MHDASATRLFAQLRSCRRSERVLNLCAQGEPVLVPLVLVIGIYFQFLGAFNRVFGCRECVKGIGRDSYTEQATRLWAPWARKAH